MNESRMACVVCGCTQERGCHGGCGWCSLKELVRLNCEGPLCTVCGMMIVHLVIYRQDVSRFRLAPLMRAVKLTELAERFVEARKARTA